MSPDPRLQGISRILEVMDALRGDEGCSWDKAQTLESLKPFLLEECYEVLEALDQDSFDPLREELGDLLFQVVFMSRINEEQQRFHIGQVGDAIADKLIRRHPHIFSDSKDIPDWELQKRAERGSDASILDGVPAALPSLARSQRLQDKAARVGFDWPDAQGPLDKITEETAELVTEIEAKNQQRIFEETGDLLFSVVALSRHLQVNAEEALRQANKRFEGRFRCMETSGENLEELSLDQLEELWQKAKQHIIANQASKEASTPFKKPKDAGTKS